MCTDVRIFRHEHGRSADGLIPGSTSDMAVARADGYEIAYTGIGRSRSFEMVNVA
jgi:hypothetical protein